MGAVKLERFTPNNPSAFERFVERIMSMKYSQTRKAAREFGVSRDECNSSFRKLECRVEQIERRFAKLHKG
jgi:hypothetical protein